MQGVSDEFYAECRAYAYRLARRWFGAGEAEDIAQEVMVRLVRHLPNLDLSQPVQPWLATVTRNVGINARRDRHDIAVETPALEQSLGPAPDVPQLTAERADQLRFLRAALRRLSPPDAELIAAHEVDGRPLVDIARASGADANAIRQRLFRARHRLRMHYAALGGPRRIALPSPLAASWCWVRSRRQPRRAGMAAAAAAVVALAATMGGDGEQRLLPVPQPPTAIKPAEPQVQRSGAAPVAAVARPATSSGHAVPRPDLVWRHLTHGPASPPPRSGGAMVYDEARHEYLLFGGRSVGSEDLDDTWTSPDGQSWIRRTPAESPTARNGARMVYDATRQQVVLFGGGGDEAEHFEVVVADRRVSRGSVGMGRRTVDYGWFTWTWDGSNWTKHVTSDRPPDGPVAFDRARGVAIVVAAPDARPSDGLDEPQTETWQWDGTSWDQLTSPVIPTRRRDMALSYDVHRQRVVLYGGIQPSEANEWPPEPAHPVLDTWSWDGHTWTPEQPVHRPGARSKAATFATQRGPVLHGGLDASGVTGETWVWTDRDWRQLTGPEPPPACERASAYNPDRGEILLFSGYPARTCRTDLGRVDRRLGTDSYVGKVDGGFASEPSPDRGPRDPAGAVPVPLPPPHESEPGVSRVRAATRALAGGP